MRFCLLLCSVFLIAECAQTPSPCAAIATCNNTYGSYSCSCPRGYTGRCLVSACVFLSCFLSSSNCLCGEFFALCSSFFMFRLRLCRHGLPRHQRSVFKCFFRMGCQRKSVQSVPSTTAVVAATPLATTSLVDSTALACLVRYLFVFPSLLELFFAVYCIVQ